MGEVSPVTIRRTTICQGDESSVWNVRYVKKFRTAALRGHGTNRKHLNVNLKSLESGALPGVLRVKGLNNRSSKVLSEPSHTRIMKHSNVVFMANCELIFKVSSNLSHSRFQDSSVLPFHGDFLYFHFCDYACAIVSGSRHTGALVSSRMFPNRTRTQFLGKQRCLVIQNSFVGNIQSRRSAVFREIPWDYERNSHHKTISRAARRFSIGKTFFRRSLDVSKTVKLWRSS